MKNEFDLAIVGAGILGSFAAYHALQLGKRVLLVEAGKTPKGASVRNFGQVVPSGLGLDGWRQLGIRSLEIYQEIGRSLDLPIQKEGSLYIASDEQEQQLLEEMKQLDHDMNYESHSVSLEQARLKLPSLSSDYFKYGLSYPDEISLDSPQFLAAFHAGLQRDSNLTFLTSTNVSEITKGTNGVVVHMGNSAKANANEALVCCGHKINQLFAEHLKSPDMEISRLQMMASNPLNPGIVKGNILTGLTIRRYESFRSCLSYAELTTPERLKPFEERGIHVLFKQARNGEILIGDSHDYYTAEEADSLDFHIDQSVNELVLNEAHRILPIPGLTINRSWNGFYSQDNSNGVLTKTLDERIHLVTGIGGKGMTSGPAFMERIISNLYSGKNLEGFAVAA